MKLIGDARRWAQLDEVNLRHAERVLQRQRMHLREKMGALQKGRGTIENRADLAMLTARYAAITNDWTKTVARLGTVRAQLAE